MRTVVVAANGQPLQKAKAGDTFCSCFGCGAQNVSVPEATDDALRRLPCGRKSRNRIYKIRNHTREGWPGPEAAGGYLSTVCLIPTRSIKRAHSVMTVGFLCCGRISKPAYRIFGNRGYRVIAVVNILAFGRVSSCWISTINAWACALLIPAFSVQSRNF
jgi:hypothetical protein